MNIEIVGVVGAGVIGTGVAQTLVETGYQVILVDVSQGQLEKASREMKRQVRLRRLLGKNRDMANADAGFGRLTLSTDYHSLAAADFVIENVTENWNVKKQAYARVI